MSHTPTQAVLVQLLYGLPFVALLVWWWRHAPTDDPRSKRRRGHRR